MLAIMTTLARWSADTGWSGGWDGPWWLLIPLLWIVVAAGLVWVFARRRNALANTPNAVDILSARYARSEIDTDDYRQRLDELKGLR